MIYSSVIKLFKYILENTTTSELDFDYIERMALDNGLISFKDWQRFKKEYVQKSNCLELVRKRLNENTKKILKSKSLKSYGYKDDKSRN